MNTFGRLFKVSIFGESHGECVGVLVDGCPAGLPLAAEEFREDLKRRQGGQPGTTPRKEKDIPQIESGLLDGRTTGAPILILIENQNVRSTDYEEIMYKPRPGHADFVAHEKFGGFNDHRGGGHFSGRLTAGLVAAGVIAKKVIKGVTVKAVLTEAGGSPDIDQAVLAAMEANDSIGGIVECTVSGLPVGLGEPFFDSVESLIGHVVFSIPAVRGIEFGAGFGSSKMRGSACNDEILDRSGRTRTNNSGGISGGITNGNDIYFRVAVKPTSSIARAQRTIDLRTGEQTELLVTGRHDACIALRVPVIVEAATAIVLADLMLLEQLIRRISN